MAAIDQAVKDAGGNGGFAITRDSYDRSLTMWKDMEIAPVGYNTPGIDGTQGTPIIVDNQDANGNWPGHPGYNTAAVNPNNSATGGNFTSGFIMVKDDGNRFGMWQVEDPWIVRERLPSTRQYYVLLDQWLGIWNPDPLALSLYYGLNCNGSTAS